MRKYRENTEKILKKYWKILENIQKIWKRLRAQSLLIVPRLIKNTFNWPLWLISWENCDIQSYKRDGEIYQENIKRYLKNIWKIFERYLKNIEKILKKYWENIENIGRLFWNCRENVVKLTTKYRKRLTDYGIISQIIGKWEKMILVSGSLLIFALINMFDVFSDSLW